MENPDFIEDGYILLARKILYGDTYRQCINNDQRVMIFTSLLLANHKDGVWKGIEVRRGQFITSVRHFAKITHTSEKKVRNFWKKFETMQFLAHKRTHHYSVITVLNYDKYQSPDNYKGHTKGQAEGTQRATNNNDNNEKNDNNDKTFEEIFKTTPGEVLKTVGL